MFDRRYLISSYTRADAIADGQLIEIDHSVLQEAGICLPATVSVGLFAALEPTSKEEKMGQSFQGRLWDVLMVFRAFAKDVDDCYMKFSIQMQVEDGLIEQEVVARCGPDDDGNPCLTFMTLGCD
jgi:hypothetical protein